MSPNQLNLGAPSLPGKLAAIRSKAYAENHTMHTHLNSTSSAAPPTNLPSP
jgi:hypothetical protein